MKKIVSLFLALLMILSSIPITTLADDTSDTLTSSDGKFEYQIILNDRGKTYGEITKYLENDSSIVLPAEIDGCKIVGVSCSVKAAKNVTISEGIEYISGLFYTKSDVVVNLPSTLKYIGKRTFYYTDIKSINFPEGLQAIAEEAFYGVNFTNTNITLPESLEYLEYKAFMSCDITSVSIGSKTQIGGASYKWPSEIIGGDSAENTSIQDPFYCCSYLQTITIDENNPYINVYDDILYKDDMKTLVRLMKGKTSITIPDSVEFVCKNVFKGLLLDSVIIGTGLTEIGANMFDDTLIRNLTFAEGSRVKTIQPSAFIDARITNDLVLPASVRNIEKTAFKGVKAPSISFEDGSSLQRLESQAFANTRIPEINFDNCTHLYYINEDAFSGSTISKIDLSNTYVSEIMPNTFSNCASLETVILSDYTETVWDDSFKNCTALRRINRGQVSSFYADAFKGCDASLIENTNPREPIKSDTFGDFKYTEYADGVTVTKYIGNGGDVVIPDEIDGKPVTEIGQHTFYNKKNIDSIVLPCYLKKIYYNAFASSDIKHISPLPDSVRYIGSYAFAWNNFDSFTLNEGVEYIGDYALEECKITYIPDSVKHLGFGSLEATTVKTISFGAGLVNIDDLIFEMNDVDDSSVDELMLESIMVSESNPKYSSVDGVLYNKDKTELIRYPTEKTDNSFTVPSSVKRIKSYAFKNVKYLKNVTITENVGEIEDEAFEYCKSIENAEFTDNAYLTSLFYTFNSCTELKKVTFGKHMAIKRMRCTFYKSSVEEVTIPSSVRYMSWTFANATKLTNVKIEEGIEMIGPCAFKNTAIQSINLPDSVTRISASAFANCTNLKSIDFRNVRYIGSLAFDRCTSLTSIDLTGVRYDNSENKNSFRDCTNLTKLYFSREDGIEQFIGEDNVADNETVETVVIGGSINEIKSRAFANCKNLSVAMIGDGVTTIDDTAFDGCDKLTILCTEESYAAKYAAKNSIRYTTLTVDSIPDQQYTGKAVTPAVTVRFGGDKLTSGSDYSTQYSDNVKVGSAKVTVVGLGDYSIYGALARFNIVHTVHKYTTMVVKPTYAAKGYTLHTCSLCGKSYKSDYTAKLTVPKTTITKLTKKKKAFTVKWKKVSVATGYQIQYCTTKSFKTKKTVTVKGAKNVAKTVTKLKANKKYYVRVRTYTTYKGNNYYSVWSNTKTVITNK